FKNLSYFEKAKDLRPTLYDEKQTSSLKPYVSNVIIEKIIIDLEDEVVNLLEKEKVNLETIESLKSKGFKSSESAIFESENQNENDCHKIEKVCDKEENPKDEFEWQTVERSSRPSKMSKLVYTYFIKLIINYFLSHNKSIPHRSSSKLHSSQDDQPITKLSNTTKSDYMFGMEIPDTMISDAIKKLAGCKFYMAKKVESKPKEQHISQVKSGRGKGLMWEYLENSFNAITPYLPTEEPDNSLSMGDEHLSSIPETESDEVIKSSVDDLVPIQSDDCTLSDDDSFEDIDYIEASPPDSELVSLEEVKDDILREKLLNINLLIAKNKSLNNNLIPDCVLKSPSPFLIPIEDSDPFFKNSDTSLSYSDNSLLEFETFSDHTEETSSGRSTTHAANSLLEYDSFIFVIEPG
nr:hypothetical protein [Tanacetum cinerariifolium]